MTTTRTLFWLSMLSLVPGLALAQGWGRVEGNVAEAGTGAALPGVTVVVDGTNFGTATDEGGRYALRIPAGRYALRFSAIGFVARVDSVVVRRDAVARLDVRLAADVVEMDGVTVEDTATPVEAGVFEIEPQQVRDMPGPFKGFRALKVLPGVATNNELSNQYSVRGGGFNENLIFINGFEVFMPFRPRQGEQEGLGLLNPELAAGLTLYTGGFPARYGGKLASALDVRYRRPEGEPLRGSAFASLLDAGATLSSSAMDGRLGWIAGVRKAQARRFFATQELKGEYRPDYTDVQGLVAYRLAPGHEVQALGLYADHTFDLDPRGRKTYFGIVSADPSQPSDLQSVWINYDSRSRETDGYRTGFAGLRLTSRLAPSFRAEHDLGYFETVETEQYALFGKTVIYDVDPNSDPGSEEGKIPRGTADQEERADNRVAVSTATAQGRYLLTRRRHAAEAGWSLRRLRFDDRLDEQGAVQGRDLDGNTVRIVIDSLRDDAALDARQAALYVQDAVDLLPTAGRLVVTAGVRADYFDFNDEWTVSPRLSARLAASERLTLTGAWGLYYQAPTYRELRGAPLPGETIEETLNRDLKSQRAMQVVAGAEYFLPRRRLYLRGEAYYKDLTHLISYTLENVRVEYSGENDAEGHTYGLDLQVRGELVPGLESWINYSFLVAREEFLDAFRTDRTEGLLPRPSDQRHTFSLFVQDYIPTDPTWKLHLRALFGSGLPYTPPVPGERIGSNLVTQVPGDRFSARYPEFRRIDAGVTKQIAVFGDGPGGPVVLDLTAELLNVFDMTNTVAYAWVPDQEGIWQRVPTRLTPRTINARLRVSF
ncbi:MAG: TonB-dependent receptor [Rhodothermales bacterium]|nr:TonB-dependent receptor [Rhodothermales bacterium]